MRWPGGEALRTFTAAGLLAWLGAPLGGCSFSIPALVSAPEDTTGSIRKVEQRLAADLNQEDWRRAKGALALALDLQGNGKPVKWDNPETEMAGEIAAVGSPFVESDEVCRRFRASVDPPSAPPRSVDGVACRLAADEWAIRDVGQARKG